MKDYSSKSAAKKGAKRAGLDVDTLEFAQNAQGRWYWVEAKEEAVIGEFTYCPNCDIHLSNGVIADGDENFKGKTIRMLDFQYECMACGEEFGPKLEVKPNPVKPKVDKSEGLKIEKDRPEQNGITRPSIGGKCREVWDFCDEFYKSGNVPMPKNMREVAVKNDWNPNNAVIEMYQWRKFNGIKGRQA